MKKRQNYLIYIILAIIIIIILLFIVFFIPRKQTCSLDNQEECKKCEVDLDCVSLGTIDKPFQTSYLYDVCVNKDSIITDIQNYDMRESSALCICHQNRCVGGVVS